MRITKRAAAIAPSMTLEITAKAKQMKNQGISVVSFGAGEPDFNTPEPILFAAQQAMEQGFTKYTPASGMPELKQAIAEKLKRENGLEYTADQIVVSNGAKHSLYNVMQAIVEDGDEVIIPAPYWLTYPELVKLCNGVVVSVTTRVENDFKITAEEFEGAITSKTKAIILNSPNNPTGAVYSKEELYSLAEIAIKHNVFVISDEIYEKLIYDGKEHVSIATHSAEMKDLTIIINGMSKAFSMTGWRIGYLAAPLDIVAGINSIQSHETSNPCSVAQAASVAAFHMDDNFIKEMRNVFDDRRIYAINRIRAIKGLDCLVPQGAFYIMVNVSAFYGKTVDGITINGSLSFAKAMLNRGVAVIPGEPFEADDYVRLSYAIDKAEIEIGLDRIEKFANEVL
ncbi:MAG: pyridoxal phosphate-dependent aminotransferase [Clostridia bacterium]|nr:pyridoxal phosphate-dependent aminotransferase [Clostridia bacterium]